MKYKYVEPPIPDFFPGKFEVATDDLDHYLELGQEAHNKLQGLNPKQAFLMSTELAEEKGISLSLLNNAQKVASVYDDLNLGRFLLLCRLAKFLPCREHLNSLATVEPKDLEQWEEDLVDNRWNTRQLRRQVKLRYGKRSNGGKKYMRPRSRDEAVYQFECVSERWEQLSDALKCAVIDQVNELGEKPPFTLDKGLLKLLQEVDEAMGDLKDAFVPGAVERRAQCA